MQRWRVIAVLRGRPAVLWAISLAALELRHPTWPDGSVAQAVQAAGLWWVPLHVSLILAYVGLAVALWRAVPARPARVLLAAFAACNTAYLALDGLAVGILARTNPAAADALWNSPPVTVLANVTGATWAAALLATAVELDRTAARRSSPSGRLTTLGAVVTWFAFVATASPLIPFVATAAPLIPAAALAIARLAALATGAVAVYQRGASSVPFALLVFAAVLRQHVGPEAALGLVCVGLAFALRGRSAPAAGSPP